MAEMPPIGDLPLEDVAPMVAAWFELLRGLSPRFTAETDRELTSAEETALRHLIKIGAVEVVMRFEFTNKDNEVQVDYLQLSGNWMETTSSAIANASKPFLYRFVRARLTSVGQTLAACARKGEQDPQSRVYVYDRICKAPPAESRAWPVPAPEDIPPAVVASGTAKVEAAVGEGNKALNIQVAGEMAPRGCWSQESLVVAFGRFYETLDATTIPDASGGRRVAGFSHAIALSEETEFLHDELARADRRLSDIYGITRKTMPPGVSMQESDSPGGPSTPIPNGDMVIQAVPIGQGGADARLMAAIEGASRVTAFPLAKWNAMQAQNPGGNHHRWHADDVITGEELAQLESTAKLLRLYETPSVGDAPAPVDYGDGMTLSDLVNKVGRGDQTLRNAATAAKVRRPKRGQHSYVFPWPDIVKIAKADMKKSANSKVSWEAFFDKYASLIAAGRTPTKPQRNSKTPTKL